jgi:hypothetical protein
LKMSGCSLPAIKRCASLELDSGCWILLILEMQSQNLGVRI